jgi:hypothetical protein
MTLSSSLWIFVIVIGAGIVAVSTAEAADNPTVCSIANHPEVFDHQKVDLKGLAADVTQTTSQRRNDYSTFNLIDPSGCGPVKVFIWGHPKLATGAKCQVNGSFETQYHQGPYTFRNEVQATSVTCE